MFAYLFANILSQNFQRAPGVLDYLLQVPSRTANRIKSLRQLFLNFNDVTNTLKAAIFSLRKWDFIIYVTGTEKSPNKNGKEIGIWTQKPWEIGFGQKMLGCPPWTGLLVNNSPWLYRSLKIS